jgi:hypothetical protein
VFYFSCFLGSLVCWMGRWQRFCYTSICAWRLCYCSFGRSDSSMDSFRLCYEEFDRFTLCSRWKRLDCVHSWKQKRCARPSQKQIQLAQHLDPVSNSLILLVNFSILASRICFKTWPGLFWSKRWKKSKRWRGHTSLLDITCRIIRLFVVRLSSPRKTKNWSRLKSLLNRTKCCLVVDII